MVMFCIRASFMGPYLLSVLAAEEAVSAADHNFVSFSEMKLAIS